MVDCIERGEVRQLLEGFRDNVEELIGSLDVLPAQHEKQEAKLLAEIVDECYKFVETNHS